MPGTQTFVDGDATGWQNVASVVAIVPKNIVLWPMTRPLFGRFNWGGQAQREGWAICCQPMLPLPQRHRKGGMDDSRYAEC